MAMSTMHMSVHDASEITLDGSNDLYNGKGNWQGKPVFCQHVTIRHAGGELVIAVFTDNGPARLHVPADPDQSLEIS